MDQGGPSGSWIVGVELMSSSAVGGILLQTARTRETELRAPNSSGKRPTAHWRTEPILPFDERGKWSIGSNVRSGDVNSGVS